MLSGNITSTTIIIIIIITTNTAITIRFKTKDSGNWARIFDFANAKNINNILFSVNRNNAKKIGYIVITSVQNIGTIDLDVNDDVWRHLVWTISTDGTWKFYINGVLYQTDVSMNVPNNVYRQYAWFGKTLWANEPSYNGFMDDFRIYNTALDATDVTNLYQHTGTGPGNTNIIIN